MTFQVFISYKSEYRDFARKVQSQLKHWGYATWFDMDDIPKGAYFRHEIQKGLDGSDVLVGVMTQEAFDSREVMAEWDYFLSQDKELLPLKYRECKPLYHLVTIQWIDFVNDEASGFSQLKDRLGQLATLPEQPAAPTPLPAAAPAPAKPPASEPIDKLDDLILDKPKPGAPITPPLSMPAPAAPPAQAFDRRREQQASGDLTLLTSPARKSRAGWLRPALAVASLVVVVGIVALMVLLNSGPLPSPPAAMPQPGISPLIPLAGLLIVAAAVYIARARGVTLFGAGEDAQVTQQLNRQRMLDKVEEFWIRGVLDKALEAGRLELGLSAAPGMVLRHKDYGDYALPREASILDVFNDLNRELLILGAPGAGKTVLMLQLAQRLIEQARNPTLQSPPRVQGAKPDTHKRVPTESPLVGTPLWASAAPPIPVVFNLSSWAAERKPLAEWLADELRLKYQVPKKVAKEWVEGEQLLLLLDGLDEVNEQYRNDCVDAINTFRQQYRSVDLAVCSRIADYELLTRKLDLRGAVALEPLNDDQIKYYLDRPELTGLRAIMRQENDLREMAQTPFLLNTLAYAYAGNSALSLKLPASDDPAKARRAHVFDAFVSKRLANVNTNRDIGVPYSPRQVRHYLAWLARKMTEFELTIFYIEVLQPNWLTTNRLKRQYKYAPAMLGAFGGVIIALMQTTSIVSLLTGGIIGTVLGISVGRGGVFTIETLSWSLKGVVFALKDVRKGYWLDVGLLSLFAMLLMTLHTGNLLTGLLDGLITMLAAVLSFALVGGIFSQNVSAPITVYPNQGVWLSLRNGVLIFALYIVIAILFGRVGEFLFFPTLILGLGASALVGFGLSAVIRHFFIHLILWRAGDAPLNYAHFLDYCASAGLLRKVGGGYIFAHRYLLEYFAEQ